MKIEFINDDGRKTDVNFAIVSIDAAYENGIRTMVIRGYIDGSDEMKSLLDLNSPFKQITILLAEDNKVFLYNTKLTSLTMAGPVCESSIVLEEELFKNEIRSKRLGER